MEWPHYGITLSGDRTKQPIRFWVVASLLALLVVMLTGATIGQITQLLLV